MWLMLLNHMKAEGLKLLDVAPVPGGGRGVGQAMG